MAARRAILFSVTSFALCFAPVLAEQPTLRFDMGGDASVIAEGCVRIGADGAYSAAKGYGWESTGQANFSIPTPPREYTWVGPGGQVIPRGMIICTTH